MECKICGSKNSEVVYKGIIRDGRFGNYTKEDVEIYKCSQCGARCHENCSSSELYESSEYRQKMGEKITDYEVLHDREVLDKLNYTGSFTDCWGRTYRGFQKKTMGKRIPYICLFGGGIKRL